MPRKRAKTSPRISQKTIIDYITQHPDRPLKLRALARELDVAGDAYPAFRELVRNMLDNQTLTYGPGRSLRIPRQEDTFVGTFRMNPRGFGFIERHEGPDVFVSRHNTAGAREGDSVAARLLRSRKRGKPRRDSDHDRVRAEVTRIIERKPVRWVGVLTRDRRDFVIHPIGRDAPLRVRIDDPRAKNAQPDDWVVVQPVKHERPSRTTLGEITERIGPANNTRCKLEAVKRWLDLPDAFPLSVKRTATRAANTFDPNQRKGRKDLRDLLSVTVDPIDARDFDDAISVEPLGERRWRLGVHIADVAHFVSPGGVIDREARKRGTSVYLPGQVVPMLPEVLANEVCSLQPQQPRFTKSVFITYDADGAVQKTSFCNSVIRSQWRLTYEQVTDVLDGVRSGLPDEVKVLLEDAAALARRIRDRRIRNGMIVLALPEVRIELDERGEVSDARPRQQTFANTIIEMFMVEANEAVSRKLSDEGIPHLRRVHAPPDPDAVEHLGPVAAHLGCKLPHKLDRKAIRQMLDAARGLPQESTINYFLLRAFAQAEYSPLDEGHFALASDDYAHFTSPIRRYPDLTVHRQLDQLIRAEQARKPRKKNAPPKKELETIGRECSDTERRAQRAERQSRDLLTLELMKMHIGKTLNGVVSGLSSAGVWVQLETYLAEGIVPLIAFGEDVWDMDRQNGVFVGRYTSRTVSLGQQVRVNVDDVDEARQQLVLTPANEGFFHKIPRRKKPRGGPPRRAKRGKRWG